MYKGKNCHGEWISGQYSAKLGRDLHNNLQMFHFIKANDGVKYTVDPKTVQEMNEKVERGGEEVAFISS